LDKIGRNDGHGPAVFRPSLHQPITLYNKDKPVTGILTWVASGILQERREGFFLLAKRFANKTQARMGATKDENKDLTDFSLRLSASARDMFFLPQRR